MKLTRQERIQILSAAMQGALVAKPNDEPVQIVQRAITVAYQVAQQAESGKYPLPED